DVSRNISDSEIVESIAGQGLSLRLRELEEELNRTLEEKLALEGRLAKFSAKEAEHELRHSEMRATLQEIEAKLLEAKIAQSDRPSADSEHRAEMARLLQLMDDMLENLPQDVIDSFARSDDYKLYEKILSIYLEGEE
ncbi:MAG: hypothetical protein R6W91_08205, partial [Thermoplasmata archaeon]